MTRNLSRREFLEISAATAGATVALGALGTSAFAQSPSAGTGKRYKFVWSPKATDNPVFHVADVGGQLRAQELGDVDFVWIGPANTDAQLQADLLDSAISAGCDGLGLSCNDADVLKPVIDRATAAGIPVITWDSDSPDSKRLSFYSIDGEAAATAGANLFLDVMKGNPSRSYAMLTGNPGAPNLEGRITAVRAVLDKSDLQLVNIEACYDDIQKGAEAVENRMTATPDLGGWFFIGGWPLFGDVNAMPQFVAATKSGKTKCVTWDTLQAECEDLVDGIVQGLIGQKYFGWGYDGVGIMYDIVKYGKTFPAFIDSGFDLVTTVDQANAFLDMWASGNFKTKESPFGNGADYVPPTPAGSPAA